MNLATAISMMVFLQGPADVPKDHWAFPAVNALFQEGLLTGYPSGKQPPLKLDKSIKQDLKKAVRVLTQWQVKGLLVGYRDHNGHLRRSEPSNYELAVAIHASWWNTVESLRDKETALAEPRVARNRFPEMAKMISMFEPELKKLGANPLEMIAELNQASSGKLRLESIELDKAQVQKWLKEWQRSNLLEGLIDGLTNHWPNLDHPLELASRVHWTWKNATMKFTGEWKTELDKQAIRREFPMLAKAISMLRSELVKLGGTPQEMIETLDQLNQAANRPFKGSR